MDHVSIYQRWLELAAEPELREELLSVREDAAAVEDRFYRELEFGTAGLRGILGAGTNRMNVYTVGRATQGFGEYLLRRGGSPTVVIAYDSRRKSEEFAKRTACVFAANGVRAWLFPTLMPTPCLSFAVRYLGCDGGVNITASHNPAEYNGYKAYGPDGCQITEEAADEIYSHICAADCFTGMKLLPFEEGLRQGSIRYTEPEVTEAYLRAIGNESLLPKDVSRDLRIVYTPLNGAGIRCVPECLRRNGFPEPIIPPEQREPDGDFPTCPYPNPENPQALEVALRCAAENHAELLIATDPDSDRMAAAVPCGGEWIRISGNQMGVLLLDYICRMRLARGTMPEKPVAVKTVVTTELCQRVAAHYGVELRNVLTGFKYIGKQILELEEQGSRERFLLGYEESCGFLTCPEIRDKDAVNASLLVCEMAAWYKAQGRTLLDRLEELSAEFGYYNDQVVSLTFAGAEGMKTMQRLMSALREEPLTALDGIPVLSSVDYLNDETGLPRADVMQYRLRGGTVVTIRPSGTEPKLKLYFSACGESAAQSAAAVGRLKRFFDGWVERHRN